VWCGGGWGGGVGVVLGGFCNDFEKREKYESGTKKRNRKDSSGGSPTCTKASKKVIGPEEIEGERKQGSIRVKLVGVEILL